MTRLLIVLGLSGLAAACVPVNGGYYGPSSRVAVSSPGYGYGYPDYGYRRGFYRRSEYYRGPRYGGPSYGPYVGRRYGRAGYGYPRYPY